MSDEALGRGLTVWERELLREIAHHERKAKAARDRLAVLRYELGKRPARDALDTTAGEG